jgi:hypothetical protein
MGVDSAENICCKSSNSKSWPISRLNLSHYRNLIAFGPWIRLQISSGPVSGLDLGLQRDIDARIGACQSNIKFWNEK